MFKKQWLEDFREFTVGNLVPFFFYNVHSWNSESLYIAVQLYIDRTKEWKFDVRELFTNIFKSIMDKSDIKPFLYNEQNIAKKIKEIVIKEGYENEQDLKDVALKMKVLIDKTIGIIDNTVEVLKNKIHKLKEEK